MQKEDERHGMTGLNSPHRFQPPATKIMAKRKRKKKTEKQYRRSLTYNWFRIRPLFASGRRPIRVADEVMQVSCQLVWSHTDDAGICGRSASWCDQKAKAILFCFVFCFVFFVQWAAGYGSRQSRQTRRIANIRSQPWRSEDPHGNAGCRLQVTGRRLRGFVGIQMIAAFNRTRWYVYDDSASEWASFKGKTIGKKRNDI